MADLDLDGQLEGVINVNDRPLGAVVVLVDYPVDWTVVEACLQRQIVDVVEDFLREGAHSSIEGYR